MKLLILIKYILRNNFFQWFSSNPYCKSDYFFEWCAHTLHAATFFEIMKAISIFIMYTYLFLFVFTSHCSCNCYRHVRTCFTCVSYNRLFFILKYLTVCYFINKSIPVLFCLKIITFFQSVFLLIFQTQEEIFDLFLKQLY